MIALALALVAVPAALALYAYALYPLLLRAAAARRPPRAAPGEPAEWPTVTVVIAAHNAAAAIGRTLERLLAADYPPGRLHVVVVSDASTDGTDDVVRSFAGRGVELVRQPRRAGKTAAENAAAAHLRGELVVCTDATILVAPDAIRRLARRFQDPRVGIVSGRDMSVEGAVVDVSVAERGYSDYEMGVRSRESRLGRIAGATGSLYAMRRALFDPALPETLTRDFASTLQAYEAGWLTIAEDDAICLVRRSPSLRAELRRKARTMAHGVHTLWHFRRLLHPRHGWMALMLASHKLARWLVFPTLPLALLGTMLLAVVWPPALVALVAAAVGLALGTVALTAPAGRAVPRPVAICGYVLAGTLAALIAWGRVLRGEHVVVWDPTARAREI